METTSTPTTVQEAARFVLDDTGWTNDNGDRADLYLRVRTENLNVLLRITSVGDIALTGTEVRLDSDDFVTAVLKNDSYQHHLIGWEFVRWVKVIAHDHRYFELTTVMEAK